MGENLRRLFDEKNAAQGDVLNSANRRLLYLFDLHGEALIAALEETVTSFEMCMKVSGTEEEYAKLRTKKVRELLAQLESEAQS